MSLAHQPALEPASLTALRAYPLLWESVQHSINHQTALIYAHESSFTRRQSTLDVIQQLIRHREGGLVAIEGAAGSGVTSLLAHLAATLPVAFWFADADDGQGALALAAQVVALRRLTMPLISPAVQSNPAALEHILAEAAAHHSADGPLILVIDPPKHMLHPPTPMISALPAAIPPGVLVLYGCGPDTILSMTPATRIMLPQSGDEVVGDQHCMLEMRGCPTDWHKPIIEAAQGNMLFGQLAAGMREHHLLDLHAIPVGLPALYQHWWQSLNTTEQHLALLLAAAGEPLPLELCAALIDANPRPTLATWQAIGLVLLDEHTAAFAHQSTRAYLAEYYAANLEQVHTDMVNLALQVLELADTTPPMSESYRQQVGTPPSLHYCMRQFARHAALGTRETQTSVLPEVAQRHWIRMRERHSATLVTAASDMAWEYFRAATLGSAVRLVRSALLASTLASLARTLSPDLVVESLTVSIRQSGREAALKHVSSIVDQLPDVQAKAQILRRMGEACHNQNMRTSAMRLLSQALDIEAQKTPAAWNEQREQMYATLAQTALELGQVDIALDIGARISHTERRGMVQTQVVRWLLSRNEVIQAQMTASRIDHESLASWARAEVAVMLARTGRMDAAEAVLLDIQSETASAWAHITLACDMAIDNEEISRQRIEQLDSPAQRDRGLAQLARTLALYDKDGDALDAAARIDDVAVRVSTLLDLRLTLEGLVAMLALEQATAVIDKLNHDVRVPLVSMLASSYAALGRTDQALRVAEEMTTGEEHDRALSRVAVALVRHGSYDQGLAIALTLADADERDWALDEMAHILAEEERWEAAEDLVAEISTVTQRAHTLADLAIARARMGDPHGALKLAGHITGANNEYARAITLIAPLLVQKGQTKIALALVQEQYLKKICLPDHTLNAIQISRYLTSVVEALADQGNLVHAVQIARAINQPLDKAQAHIAIAEAAAPYNRYLGLQQLGIALQAMLIGRDEAFRLLSQSVPVLVALGGAPLLQNVAAAIEEVDNF